MVIVLIGPMGCGKTTIGKHLSRTSDWIFEDGDDFHSTANKNKMQSGVPLDDNDREPWLLAINKHMQNAIQKDKNMVIACSALKKIYRKQLGIDQKTIHSVYLRGSADLLEKRISCRDHAYMNQSLLASQLATLEEPQNGLIINIEGTPAQITEEIINKIIKRK